MAWPQIRKKLTWVAAFIGVAISVVWFFDIYRQPQMVARILNIPSPPGSLRVVECESPVTTDVLTTCSVEISPDDFPLLLVGYHFEQIPAKGTSHTLGLPKVGPEFAVDVEFSVQPAEFKHGGFVRVLTDKDRRHAIVDLYIE
ncbi:MAG TPA: hypothetical protein VN418_03805 [Gammaproteobacteria bacterium]|nr:hypothetical protein [Gammaproteobacteria bacterium]